MNPHSPKKSALESVDRKLSRRGSITASECWSGTLLMAEEEQCLGLSPSQTWLLAQFAGKGLVALGAFFILLLCPQILLGN